MIKDNIINIEKYDCILEASIIQMMKDIYYQNKDMYERNYKVFEYEYSNKTEDKILFESHRYHVDYQLLLEGNEYIYISNLNDCTRLSEYDKKDDFQLFSAQRFDKILLNQGDFIIFMENEIHSPKHYFESHKVKRLVIKEEIEND